MTDRQLSPNFKESEFRCRCREKGYTGPAFCGGGVGSGIHPLLISQLQRLRDELGLPINVSSGYRCPAYNKEVDGASSSQHMRGTAADIYVYGMPAGKVIAVIERLNLFIGRGLYPDQNFVHVDVRSGKVTRWVKFRGKREQPVANFNKWI